MSRAMVLPALVACLSALGFAVSTSVQHRAAGAAPATSGNPLRLLLSLLGRRDWVLGAAVGLAAWLLHGLAVSLGTLGVVQPLMLLGVVFALLLRAGLDRTRPSGAEIGGAVLTVVSLAAFLAACRVAPGSGAPDDAAAAAVALAAVLVALTVVAFSARAGEPRRTAPWLGAAAGLLFATTACLLKLCGEVLAEAGVPGLLRDWPGYVLVVCGVLAVSVTQRAYQVGRLSASMPVLNVVTVLGAVSLGVLVFHETPHAVGVDLVLATLALVGIVVGLRQLETVPA